MQAVDLASRRLIDRAIEAGAANATLIKASDIAVAPWVRHKCRFGCPHFGKNFACPPYSPTPEQTAGMLQEYRRALLIEFRDHGIRDGQDPADPARVHKLLYGIERQVFLDGYYAATSYGWGHCRLCLECPAGKIRNPSLFHKKECVYPKMARPSMEASGIDVFQTVKNAGVELHVVKDKSETFSVFGLVLVE